MIIIIDYGLGNLGSIKNAFDKLNIPAQISGSPDAVKEANILILPGVGAAGQGMRNLRRNGLDKTLIDEINKGKPFLGICLGMQLLFERSEEGNSKCLGILKGKVIKFQKERKIPQIGWNEIRIKNYESRIKNQLFNKIPDNSYFYFVNSYYCMPEDKSIIVAQTQYEEKFPSVIIKDNIIATQFHPEKSGSVGFQLLENFARGIKNVN